ncbi:M20/M25/M40 family metallo-hydrolase [Naasia lichenicola]|uniref:M20/M25/M40 family metallo-hydrolase n=1 Tax=Naasia lichenicola TaxID=2565933 RepID=A0A4V3WT84_9MICO|nr:M20/M25/M40 family metallo-hydrolase [Naasia lichenicola]THG30997.1 M20/M25/M40 family metallo-hydrolase [Naasia lichenicola]
MSGSRPGSRSDDVLDLTRALVAIDSVSPSLSPGHAGEAGIATFVADRLESAGFTTRLVHAGSDERRPSVVAVRSGSRSGRTVMLNGHLDTVGVDGMDDPFTARIEGDRLVGRGTSDMKGGIAGILLAAEQLVGTDPPGRIAVTLVADEEDGSLGALAVLDALAAEELRADVCIVAEPTWLDLPVAHRGYSVQTARLTGRAGHSSQPELAVDVMPPLGELLVAIARRNRAMAAAPAHPLLGSGSLMATVARAGVAPFTIAANGELTVERRTVSGEPDDIGMRDLQEIVDAIRGDHPQVGWELEPGISRPAWRAQPSGPARELLDLMAIELPKAGAEPPREVGAPYWMESALWQEAGVPTIVCGPAGGGLHAVDEWVDIPQLQRFPIALAAAVGHFLAG